MLDGAVLASRIHRLEHRDPAAAVHLCETELGHINQLLASVSPLETPLLRQIKTFGYAITAAIGVISVLIFADGKWVRGMDPDGVGLACASIRLVMSIPRNPYLTRRLLTAILALAAA